MENKIFYCEECGQTYFCKRKPKRCKSKGLAKSVCKSTNIKRILTEEDLK